MALSLEDLEKIRAWSISDLQTAIRTFQRARPDTAGGTVLDASPGEMVEIRLLDILAQRLNPQLAATFLIPAAQQDVADRLDALWTSVPVASWTSLTPPPVAPANFFLGDILESLKADGLPALIVTSSLPAGVDIEQGGIGAVSLETATAHVLYVLPYTASRERQIEARRGADAIANILRTCRDDAAAFWQNGQVTHVARNVPRFESGPRLIVGIVTFTCQAFVPYTRRTA